MENSKIEWCDHTANFWWGCFKVSPGCKNCYAETLANRYGKNIWGPVETTDREQKTGIWTELPKWNKQAEREGKRRRVFVQSMSDFFEDHLQVIEPRIRAMRLIEDLTSLDFLILTKRPENVGYMAGAWMETGWPVNVWLGTSVENQEMADMRIPKLLRIPAKVRFLSMEPLLERVEIHRYALGGLITTDPLSWVIVGGESGNKRRPFDVAWARAIRDQCQAAGVPFFMKQIDKVQPIPADLMIREFPK